jgi:hypothetical protein
VSLPPVPQALPIVDPASVAEVARRVDFRLRSRGLWSTVTIDGARIEVALPRPHRDGVVVASVSYSREFTYLAGKVDCVSRADDMVKWILGNEEVAAMIEWTAAEQAKRGA